MLLTGPPGAGKSSVATALHDRLSDAGLSNALVEVDELQRCYPPLDIERVLAHLAMLVASYREAGCHRLIVTATIENDSYQHLLLKAAEARNSLVVRLEAEPTTLGRRLRTREPAAWSGLKELLASSLRLADEMTALRNVDLVLSTEGQEHEYVAVRIEDAMRERGYL
ncbi:AAA family ATPase [Geodermatophilus sp. SYSU D00779]